MPKDSRHYYFSLLTSAMANDVFRAKIAQLLAYDPYYIPAYLEHLWYAEERNDQVLRKEMLAYTKKITRAIFTNESVRSNISATWTTFEKESLRDLLDMQLLHERSMVEQFKIQLQRWALDTILSVRTQAAPQSGTYLRCVSKTDVEPLVTELKKVAPYWWNVYTSRAESISHHQYTHAIVLRNRIQNSVEYIPGEGVHESIATEYAHLFSLTHQYVLDFAQEHNLGLGRVAVVRLQPWRQSYRHFDSELFLEGRNRYHLVLQCGRQNILSAGDEIVNAQKGEVWFFDNHVMHRAHNRTSVPRVHVIFDGYPLLSKEKN